MKNISLEHCWWFFVSLNSQIHIHLSNEGFMRGGCIILSFSMYIHITSSALTWGRDVIFFHAYFTNAWESRLPNATLVWPFWIHNFNLQYLNNVLMSFWWQCTKKETFYTTWPKYVTAFNKVYRTIFPLQSYYNNGYQVERTLSWSKQAKHKHRFKVLPKMDLVSQKKNDKTDNWN